MGGGAGLHRHPHIELLLCFRLGQSQAVRMEKWAGAHRFPQWRPVWPLAGRQCVQKTLGGFCLQLGLYFVGGRVPTGAVPARMGMGFWWCSLDFSLFGVLVFWLEPVFLGLGHQLKQSFLLEQPVQ